MNDAIRDMYDRLEPERACELRRHNKERLASSKPQGPSVAPGSR